MVLWKQLAKAVESEISVADGEMIVREGDPGSEMFVLKSGSVVISKTIAGKAVVLAELQRGDFFGEMSLLESLPRDADARAKGNTELLVIGPGALLMRVRRDPSFALEMLLRLSGRVRSLNEQLAAALENASDR